MSAAAHAAPAYERAQGLRAGLNRRWRGLCSRYLPLIEEGSIWRISRAADARDPEQGWKLHVSATILTACAVLEKLAPLLHGRGARFKAPASLAEVQKINSGLYYGYSQVGKVFTVYPRTPAEAADIARQLHEALGRMHAPTVPFDRRFGDEGCVYYRYGAFRHLEIENPDGTRTPAIRDPDGRLVPDLRQSAEAAPAWAASPFDERQADAPAAPADSPLKTTYRVFRALTQRGRGGVYAAVDVGSAPPRPCVVKEGRRGGELNWDGRDGAWRVRNEEGVLTSLRGAGVDAPRVYGSFRVEGNYYLVTEYIRGETLHAHLLRRRRRLSLSRVLRTGAEVALLLGRVHAAGWTWRDCKPSNIMLTRAGALRPLDFEGACPVGRPDSAPWGTEGFTPPEWRPGAVSRVYEDLYALGATLHLLLTGELPNPSAPGPNAKPRRNVPAEFNCLVAELLSADPRRQPDARAVANTLLALLPAQDGGRGGRLTRRTSSPKRGSWRSTSKAGSTVR